MSLKHHYTFSELGDFAYDFTDNNFRLLKENTTRDSEARWGTYSTRLFDSLMQNDGLVPSPFYLNSFSIVSVIRFNTITEQSIFSGLNGFNNLVFDLDVNGALEFGQGDNVTPSGTAWQVQTPIHQIVAGVWYTIILRYDKPGTNAEIWINENLIAENNLATPPVSYLNDWRIGKDAFGLRPVKANLNDLKLFDHALTDTEIASYKNQAAMEMTKDTIRLWEVDELTDGLTQQGVFGTSVDFVEDETLVSGIAAKIEAAGFTVREITEGF